MSGPSTRMLTRVGCRPAVLLTTCSSDCWELLSSGAYLLLGHTVMLRKADLSAAGVTGPVGRIGLPFRTVGGQRESS